MRRPLLAVCLCLILVTAIHLLFANSRENAPGWWPWKEALPWGEDIWQETVLEAREGQEIMVAGRVYQKDENYYYIDSIQILENVANLRQEKSLDYNLILESPRESNALLGSVVVVQGTFCSFSQATNPGEFDARAYYQTIGVLGRLTDVKILGASKDYSKVQEILYRLRQYFAWRLYQIFPEKEASVMCTVLLGEKKGLDKEVKALYQRNGIVHILSISGLHISIIGMSLFQMLKKAGVPVWLAAICGSVILCLYGVMTGMGISACRAIGMYLIRMLGICLGRTYDMLTAWGVVGVIMVLGNPYYLQHSGFLLSYASILGIGVLFPIMQEIFEKVERNALKGNMPEEDRRKEILRRILGKAREGLKQSILAGISVTVMTLPIQLWFYFEVPVFSVILNLVVIPLMSLLMVTGMLVMLVPGLDWIGTVDVFILQWYESCCYFFEWLPFHNWNPGRPEVWQVITYYGALFLFLFGYTVWREQRGKDKPQERVFEENRLKRYRDEWKISAFLVLTILVIIVSGKLPAGHLVTFLDVGQGDCICLQTKTGKVYLFDCGSTSRSNVGTYVLKPFLKYHGINRVDAVFLSHSDEDHCNGVEELLMNQEEWGIEVGNVVVSKWNEENDAFATQFHRIFAGVAWKVDGIEFRCLHPGADFQVEDKNATSQCYYVDFGECSLLLTGDVEGVGEQQLTQRMKDLGLSNVTILKVAHHGSKYSTSEEFLRQVKPQAAVISCGQNNVYGHPHEETMERLEELGCTVLSTSECGAIIIEIGEGVKVCEWGKEH